MSIGSWLTRVRDQRPLVHNITNLVVTNVAANTLLALGASPVMAYAHEEVADMASIAKSLALNLGTLDPEIVVAMRLASTAANRTGVPIVLDPVGAGATPYRTRAAKEIIDGHQLAILRGNASEIGILTGAGGSVVGVDAGEASEHLIDAMRAFASAHRTVVVATGPRDLVTDGQTVWELANGHPLLAAITGSGCSLTAVIGAFVGTVDTCDLHLYAEAAIAAVTCFNVAAERAATRADGPGSFQVALLDALYHITPDEIDKAAQVQTLSGGPR